MLTEKQARGMNNLDLVNVINGTEGELWRLGHDVVHGRETNETIASSVSAYEKQRDLAYKVLGEKTGIANEEKMIEYARGELREQEKRWDDEWKIMHNEGAVFKMIHGQNRYGAGTFEVVGTYVARHGNCSYKEVVVARNREHPGIRHFDERDAPIIERISSEPIFQNVSPEERGLIKIDEYMERRTRGEVVHINGEMPKRWRDFNFAGTFVHSGFGKFHTMYNYNSIADGRDSDNEIILASPMSGQKYWVEFNESDMADMELVRK